MPAITQVYINGKFLCQKATGVQKFALGLSQAIQKKHPEVVVVVPEGKHDYGGLKVKKSGWGGGFFWEQIWLPLFLFFHSRSLLINFCNSAPLMKRKQIVSIHDLAFFKNKYWFSPSFRRWYSFLIPKLCKRSLKILTVSEFIKKEIINEFCISAEKIKVVPNGIPVMDFDEKKPFSFRYLLLTGVNNPRKNATFIISQLPELIKRNYHIVGVGADTNIYGNTKFENDENLHLFKYVDDKQYYTLIKYADAVIFPSEYEGFGIPILEALIVGTPVIVPDIEVYREAFGELPLYYSAGNADLFFQALDKINVHKPTKIDLSFLTNRYNFDKSAEILSDLIQQLINNNRS